MRCFGRRSGRIRITILFFCINLLLPGVRIYAQDSQSMTAEEEQLLAGLYAGSAVLMDGESGRVLVGKDEDIQRPMASTTKIMTCILALEQMEEETEIVTASGEASNQPKVRLGVQEGEQFYLKDLLYSLMLESHNDSAVMIAEHIGGSVRGFASLMNEKCRELGCQQTYYITPNGLDASDEEGVHSTTARELALVMRYCIRESPAKEEFLQITGTRSHTFRDVSGSRSFSCTNHNAFLDMMEGAISGKTGFTADAGYCYVGALQSGDRVFIVALLACGWPNHKSYKWQDTRALMEYGLAHYERRSFDGTYALSGLPVENGVPEQNAWSGVPEVSLLVKKKSYGFLLREQEQATYAVVLPSDVEAPVRAGTRAGRLQLRLGDQVLAEWEIQIAEDMDRRDYGWCLCQLLREYGNVRNNKKDQYK